MLTQRSKGLKQLAIADWRRIRQKDHCWEEHIPLSTIKP